MAGRGRVAKSVTLDGQTLNAQAQWSAHVSAETIVSYGGTYPVSIPGISAAIVTANARPGTT
jgi:hypothetical protein